MEGCRDPPRADGNLEKAGARAGGTASKNATPPGTKAEPRGTQPEASKHAPTAGGMGEGKHTTKQPPGRATDQRTAERTD